ncbi:MAG: serine/threonine-protein kinase [Acidimicrobiales bacterium]
MPPTMPGGLLAGRYQLESVIGRGGMATVWCGEDTRLHRRVAVKEITLPVGGDGGDGDDVRERAMREARAAARISTPAAVAVYDVLDEGDGLFLVMELVDGVSLDRLVGTRGPLSPEAVGTIGVRLCDALEAAHARGVVHRDVKPSNVLVPASPAGRAAVVEAKLADFGIARVADDPRLTRTGLVIGSPPYMAPEQAEGRAPTQATDVWGLGATLYYAVEGVGPFERDTTMAVLAAVVHEPPRAWVRAGPLGPSLAILLEKDPARRLTIAQARQALAALAEGRQPSLPPTATPGGAAERTAVAPVSASPDQLPPPHGTSRRSRRWVAGASLAALLGAGAAAAVLTADDGDPRSPSAEPATTSATTLTPTRDLEWTVHTDPATGFRIEHPAGWAAATNEDGRRTSFTDPGTGSFVLVEWTDEPGEDPVRAWRDLADRLEDTLDGYDEVGIEAVSFAGYPAAVWEFTHTEGGVPMRTVDVGLTTGDLGFAVLVRAPEERWAEMQPVFERARQSFEPPAPQAPAPDDGDDDDDDD